MSVRGGKADLATERPDFRKCPAPAVPGCATVLSLLGDSEAPWGCMERRDFIRVIGGAVAAWPTASRAQQGERVRRIGVLMSGVASDSENQIRIAAFQHGLHELGWTDASKVRIDYRWSGSDADRLRSLSLIHI